MIKGRKLVWAMSSMLLLSACTPTEAVTEEEITASSSIESSVAVASVATDTKKVKKTRKFIQNQPFLPCILKVPKPHHLYLMMAIH
jgi:ABC-type enterochelin transport system substrate-binding protein